LSDSEDLRGRALTRWRRAGGDLGLFAAVWPVLRARLVATPEPFLTPGRCRGCLILAGEVHLTPGVDAHGLCPACLAHRKKYGSLAPATEPEDNAPVEAGDPAASVGLRGDFRRGRAAARPARRAATAA
jgi:hypothetical protein